MRYLRRVSLVCGFVVSCAAVTSAQVTVPLELFTLDARTLLHVRDEIRSGSRSYKTAYAKLLRDAEKALDVQPVSVMEKDMLPPSGDKHDYTSMGRYWWPDPQKPDGLPYIRRDGETNPESEKISDHENFSLLGEAVGTLSLAYFFSGEARFARHASNMLRVWFLDSLTRMNPNLEYSQFIPGRSEGRGPGVLDGRRLAAIADAVGMLRGSEGWNESDHNALKQWYATYLDWVLTSKNGKAEAAARNNHGTWYDAQVSTVALFAGRPDVARSIVANAGEKRIRSQIQSDGSQPEELARTRSWHYSLFNLHAYNTLATVASKLGVSLWDLEPEKGRSLRNALTFLLPFATNEKEWPHPELNQVSGVSMVPVLLGAYVHTKDRSILEVAKKLGGERLKRDRMVLLFGLDP